MSPLRANVNHKNDRVLAAGQSATLDATGAIQPHRPGFRQDFVRELPSNRPPIVLMDAAFDEPFEQAVDGGDVGRYFAARYYTYHNGHASAMLGSPPGLVTLNCNVDSRSAAVVELSSRWQHSFRINDQSPIQATFTIRSGYGGLQNGLGSPHRKWVGLRDSSTSHNTFRPMDVPGIYVTLALDSTREIFGAPHQHPGNIVYVDSVGRKTFLAMWDWGQYDGNNAQTVTISLTTRKYHVTISDSNVRNLTGSLSGELPEAESFLAQAIVYCQGIDENASLQVDRVRVERLSGLDDRFVHDEKTDR